MRLEAQTGPGFPGTCRLGEEFRFCSGGSGEPWNEWPSAGVQREWCTKGRQELRDERQRRPAIQHQTGALALETHTRGRKANNHISIGEARERISVPGNCFKKRARWGDGDGAGW